MSRLGKMKAMLVVLALTALFARADADIKVKDIGRNATFPDIRDEPALFGLRVKHDGVSGDLKVAEPLRACSPLKNPEYTEPWVALIQRSPPSEECSFIMKAKHAEEAGAVAAIVFDYVEGMLLPMAKKREDPDVLIPTVFISLSSGEMLQTIMDDPRTMELQVTLLPSDLAASWPSLLASGFIALVALTIVLSTFFFLRRRRVSAWTALATGGLPGHSSEPEPRLLTENEVQRLQTHTFVAAASHENATAETCAICLDDYEEGEKLRVLECRHSFHPACIDPWLTEKRACCPVCKHAVLAILSGHRSRHTPRVIASSDSDNGDGLEEPLLTQDHIGDHIEGDLGYDEESGQGGYAVSVDARLHSSADGGSSSNGRTTDVTPSTRGEDVLRQGDEIAREYSAHDSWFVAHHSTETDEESDEIEDGSSRIPDENA